MSTNAWFSKLRNDGVIASGNSGIWITPLSGEPFRVSEVGTSPVWCGQQLVFNRNDNTTQCGPLIAPRGYNVYRGADDGRWAGATDAGNGQVDLWRYDAAEPQMVTSVHSIPLATAPGFFGPSFGYLTPFQSPDIKTLVIDGVPRQSAVIASWVADRAGGAYLYTTAPSTYARRIYDNHGNDVTIREQQDETPLLCFTAPDGLPWMLSNVAAAGTFVRMIYSAFGYLITGDLYYPDARIIGDRLCVVASDAHGAPRNLWVDFDPAKRVDLRSA